VTPANGQALALGSYVNAVMSDTPGSENALITRAFCNTAGSPVSGSFQVLDQAGAQDYQRGSYRFNSPIPLTP
jgi:hypothetical protein